MSTFNESLPTARQLRASKRLEEFKDVTARGGRIPGTCKAWATSLANSDDPELADISQLVTDTYYPAARARSRKLEPCFSSHAAAGIDRTVTSRKPSSVGIRSLPTIVKPYRVSDRRER